MRALDQITAALGEPVVCRELNVHGWSGPQPVVARWRHGGASVTLGPTDSYRLIFNISHGQIVEFGSNESLLRQRITGGSVALVNPGQHSSVKILGQADTLQFFVPTDLAAMAVGFPDALNFREGGLETLRMQFAAARTLVMLNGKEQDSSSEAACLAQTIVSLFTGTATNRSDPARGGLAPGARARVRLLVHQQIHEHGVARPSVNDLADAAGLSEHHFIKAYRKTEGTTPHAHLLLRRLQTAIGMLLQTDARVDAIADGTGFSSPSHFVSVFRKHTGVTPGAFRDAASA
jgi:AraC family transcriptional regulator